MGAVASDSGRGPSELCEGQKDWRLVGVGIEYTEQCERTYDVEGPA